MVKSRFGSIRKLLGLALLCLVTFSAGSTVEPSPADARPTQAQIRQAVIRYSMSPPSYDGVLLARVYEYQRTVGGSKCAAAATGIRHHLLVDRARWYKRNYRGSGFDRGWKQVERKYTGIDRKLCAWLDSETVQREISGLTTIWYKAQRDQFKADMSKALKQSRCELFWAGLSTALGGVTSFAVDQIKYNAGVRRILENVVGKWTEFNTRCS